MDMDPSDSAYSNLNAIHKAGNRAAGLVRQLLEYSRKADGEKRQIVLNDVVDQSVRVLERTIPKMIEIQAVIENRLWTINADPVQIEQILLNLGSNAADAMQDGGKLTIETANITLDKIMRSSIPAFNPAPMSC